MLQYLELSHEADMVAAPVGIWQAVTWLGYDFTFSWKLQKPNW